MRRPTRTVLSAAGLVLLLLLIWVARRVLLLAFAGSLIALIFTSIINQLRRLFPLRQSLGVLLVLLLFCGIAAVIGLLLAPGLISEFSQLADTLPKTFHDLAQWVQSTALYQKAGRHLPDLSRMAPPAGSAISHVTSAFATSFEAIAGVLLLGFVGLFLAANPRLYQKLALQTVPPRHRADAEEILRRVICTLKYWLLGQFISMCLIGVLVGVSFGLCGLHLSASLGVLAGIGEFIPFVGPFAAAVPALLLALSKSGQLFLIVLGVYIGIQFAEAHLIMPLVQRSTVNLPPVITLIAVFFLGNALGLLGMFVAAPLTAVALVLFEEIYLKRCLGETAPAGVV